MNCDFASGEPIGGIARRHPGSIAVFDRLAIDYCCHGGDSLAEACARASVPLEAVLAALDEVVPVGSRRGQGRMAEGATDCIDPSGLSTAALCDAIEAVFHRRAREALERLPRLLDRVKSAHGASEPAVAELAAIAGELRDEMLEHMVREERVLFPWIRRLASETTVHVGPPWSVRRPIDCMVHDHLSVAAAFERIRALAPRLAPIAATCATMAALLELLEEFERETRHHVHLENNVLFVDAVRAESHRADAAGRARA